MNSKLLIGVAVIFLLAGGGGGAYLMLGQGKSAPAVEKKAVEPGNEGSGGSSVPVFVKLDPLSAPVMRHGKVDFYYFVSIELAVTGMDKAKIARERMPLLRDALLRELSARPLDSDTGSDTFDLDALKKRLLRVTQKTYGDHLVDDVLIVSVVRGYR